jgi:hypothetical protein
MNQCATPPIRFAPLLDRPLEASFDAGRLTSDGGLAWLREAEDDLAVCAALAAEVPEWRRGTPRHTLRALVTQRVFQIACGYEDQNDATTLRRDPLLKLVCGRLPCSAPDLASQPTLSRLENAVDARACYRLAWALGQVYLRARERDGIPTRIVLDLDSTDDPTHGRQEGSAYHGYYDQHQYLPVLIFDGDTDQLVTAVLRRGDVHASHGVVAILKRVVRALRARWPGVQIAFRADSGCAVPAVYAFCEREDLEYTIGLIPNPRLAALAAPLLTEAQAEAATTGPPTRRIGEARYRAGSWPRDRRGGDGLRLVHRPGGTGELDQRPETGVLRRSVERPPVLGQPVPPPPARGRLLAARYRASLADPLGGAADAAGHAPVAAGQDRRLGP